MECDPELLISKGDSASGHRSLLKPHGSLRSVHLQLGFEEQISVPQYHPDLELVCSVSSKCSKLPLTIQNVQNLCLFCEHALVVDSRSPSTSIPLVQRALSSSRPDVSSSAATIYTQGTPAATLYEDISDNEEGGGSKQAVPQALNLGWRGLFRMIL